MRKPDYGLDAPGVILGSIGIGACVLVLAALVESAWLVAAGCMVAALGVVTFLSSRYGKLRLRDRLLDDLHVGGDQRILDVGCGRGLLLVGAAKRLTAGKAVGLDLWVQADQFHNSKDAALTNARLEGVDQRIEVHDGDMRSMPFENDSFDIVVSNLAIHNVATNEGRRKALAEVVRVLKPGGRVGVMDLAFTADYVRWLEEAGLNVERRWPAAGFFPPLGIVTAYKPTR